MFCSTLAPENRPRRGNVLSVTALCLVPVLGTLALVLDGGLMMVERRHAQAVADASARAAAYWLFTNWSQYGGLDNNNAAQQIGLQIAADNGYTNDGTTSSVTVNIPPQSGLFKNKPGYAEALVTHNQPRLFSAIWGQGTMTVTARSVARGLSISSGYFLMLDPSMKDALSATGNAGVTCGNGSNGSVIINSNNSEAVKFTGNGKVIADNINITGGANVKPDTFVEKVTYGCPPTPDPLASLPPPDKSTMTTQRTTQLKISGGSYVLNPGVYIGGIDMSGNSSVTLNPGIYYIDGGGITGTESASITGTNVMIYNAPKSSNDQIKLTGSGDITLSPPSSGTYAGICIYQDRTSSADFSLTGSGTVNVTGGIYLAGASASLTGNGGTDVVGSFFIADNAKLTGNGQINVGAGSNQGRDICTVE